MSNCALHASDVPDGASNMHIALFFSLENRADIVMLGVHHTWCYSICVYVRIRADALIGPPYRIVILERATKCTLVGRQSKNSNLW